jgi:hypothetical protein
MSSSSILEATTSVVQAHVLPYIPQVWYRQFQFGLNTLALQPFISGNANARTTAVPAGTAESKMSRLLHNEKLPNTLAKITIGLAHITKASVINIDHSDFNGLVALVFAVQTRKGRALPVFLDTAYSGKLSARDDAPKRIQTMRKQYMVQEQESDETDRTIAALKALHTLLGFWPKLVFDRGFGGQRILQFLVAEGATFFIRMKAKRLAEFGGEIIELRNLPQKDTIVTLAGLSLRIIRSPKNGKNDEPWYILTNDTKRSRTKIVRIYYHRFEIEETFRDTKSILGLGKAQFNKPLSLKILLWFVILGILILYNSGLKALGALLWRELKPRGHKKRISWFRMLYEKREQEICQAAYGCLASSKVLE